MAAGSPAGTRPESMDDWVRSKAMVNHRPDTLTLTADPIPDTLFCPIYSVDDHVLEPPTLFEGRLPAKLQDGAPHVTTADNGLPLWVIDGTGWPVTMANGAAGIETSEWGFFTIGFEETRAGVTDPKARLGDMDLAGVWASLCFGSLVWGFAGTRFSKMSDQDVGLASLKAYNDWMIEEWCATAPDRYIPCQLPWMTDPETAAAEIRRNAERGYRAISFSENPEGLGFPNIYDRYWDPLFAACQETETVVNLHVGSSGNTRHPSTSSPSDVSVALFPVSGLEALIDWIYAGVPVRFPDLKIALSEAGVSWVPMALERLRRAYDHDVGRDWPYGSPPPEELVHRNFFFCSIEDPSAFRLLDLIGEDNVMVETDYPHFDTTWPGCQEMIRKQLHTLPAAVVRKVCYSNAARLYRMPLPPPDLVARSETGST
jgi:predicted TIM-barrel fold metal-dependent hydrolase